MNRSLLVLPLLASSLVAAIAGCKTDNGTQGSSGVCGALFDAYDAYYAKCTPVPPVRDRAAFVKNCETDLAAPGASGASGPVGDCASTIQGLTATCGTTGIAVCKTSGGSLATGAACGNNLQCASTWCKGGGVTGSSTGGALVLTASCGVCAEPVAIGQACVSGDNCADQGVCNYGSGTGKCLALVKNDVGGHCSSLPGATFDECKAGLSCGTDNKCRAPSASGGDCNDNSDCNYPLACSNKVCGDAKPAGAACAINVPGSGCARNLLCDPSTKLCAAITHVEPGGTCDGNTRGCAVGSCHVPTVTDGGMATGICPAVLNEGDACDAAATDKICGGYLYCIGGKCTAYDPGTCK